MLGVTPDGRVPSAQRVREGWRQLTRRTRPARPLLRPHRALLLTAALRGLALARKACFCLLGEPAADLSPGVEAELVEDIGDMGFHGARGQEQPGRDLPVGKVVRD